MLTVVVDGGLGDCLLTTPFLRHFAQSSRYDLIRCAVRREAVQIFDLNPHVDILIPCDGDDLYFWALPERKAAVFSPYVVAEEKPGHLTDPAVMGLFRFNQGCSSVVRQLAAYYRIELADESLEIFTSQEDRAWAGRAIRRFSGRPFVIVNNSSPNPQKTYPLPLWNKVLGALKDRVYLLELTGEEPSSPFVHRTLPYPPLRRSAALYRLADCVLTIDSFPGHLAAAVGTPGVVLFGPSSPVAFGHRSNRNLRSMGCPPCADSLRRFDCEDTKCIDRIDPGTVAEKVLGLVER